MSEWPLVEEFKVVLKNRTLFKYSIGNWVLHPGTETVIPYEYCIRMNSQFRALCNFDGIDFVGFEMKGKRYKLVLSGNFVDKIEPKVKAAVEVVEPVVEVLEPEPPVVVEEVVVHQVIDVEPWEEVLDYENLKVSELKGILREKGLSTSGSKKKLLERLENA